MVHLKLAQTRKSYETEGELKDKQKIDVVFLEIHKDKTAYIVRICNTLCALYGLLDKIILVFMMLYLV